MKSIERTTEAKVEIRPGVSRSSGLNFQTTQPKVYHYVSSKQEPSKQKAMIKIDRRYSFDDNGGGYQGL